MASPELERLRQETLARHRAATAKISRNRNMRGVELAGSAYDPRYATPAEIRKMNTRQAQAHLNRLNAFTNRRTAFEPGANMTPLPRAKVAKFRTYESKTINRGRAEFNAMAALKLPDIKDSKGKIIERGKTLGEVRADQDKVVGVGYHRGNRAYPQRERVTSNIKGERALEALTQKMRDASKGGYKRENMKMVRDNMVAALEGGGVAPSIVDRAKALSDNQVNVLWNYHPTFAANTGEKYFFQTNADNGGTMRPNTSHADMESTLNAQIGWAEENVPVRAPQAVSQSARGRRR